MCPGGGISQKITYWVEKNDNAKIEYFKDKSKTKKNNASKTPTRFVYFDATGKGTSSKEATICTSFSLQRNDSVTESEIYHSFTATTVQPKNSAGPGVICGLSLLVLYFAPIGFSPGTPVFPSPQKPTFDLT